MGWTLDSGALIAAERNDHRYWTAARLSDEMFTVPAVVLAEVWRGAHNANLARALRGCDLEAVDVELAKSAGVLCGQVGTNDPVDAIVVVSAARRGDDIVTTDPEDLRALAAVAPGVGRILDLNAL